MKGKGSRATRAAITYIQRGYAEREEKIAVFHEKRE